MLKYQNYILGVIGLCILTACGSGSTSDNSTVYSSIAIPATTYPDGLGSKFAVYTNAGNGQTTLTEIDTGSDLYVIESSYVGSDIVYTGESISILYDHGTVQRSGLIAYTSSIKFVSESGTILIGTTESSIPIVVVDDGVISNSPNHNHAIMGMRMDGNVSVKLFLPYPYNQMFIMDMPNQQLIFGNFSTQQLESFGMIQVIESACNTYSVTSSSTNLCWNDMHLPVNYIATYNGEQVESQFDSLFDSGASTTFQFSPLPNWLVFDSMDIITNPIQVNINTTHGLMGLELTQPSTVVDTNYNGGIVNVGNNIFNYYQILYNQASGQIGLNKVANPDTITVPLVYKLQGESMGLHMPLMVGNNAVYVGVDTGSVGLRVLESAITDNTGIEISSEIESYSYQDGVSLTGFVATAPITIDGVSETIKFMLITNVSCVLEKPDCPKNAFSASGRAGLIGVALYIGGSSHGVWNPLSQLPGNLANGFYINGNQNTPGLTIGLNASNIIGFDYIDLESIAQPNDNKAPYPLWDVSLPIEVLYPSIDGVTTITQTGRVLYDTGTALYTIYNVAESEEGIFASNLMIEQKQQLNTTRFDWSFSTGDENYINRAIKTQTTFPLIVNTGNIPFIHYNILYNVESGKMGFGGR